MYRIYVIRNEANGMKYVGKTKKQLHIRLHEH